MNARGVTLSFSTVFITETCCYAGCGIVFAAEEEWMKLRQKDHAWWYCPNGHRQQYTGESDKEKIKRLEQDKEWFSKRLNEANAREEEARRSLAATKGVLTRTKKKLATTETRVANGVCPCCNRTFANLARHMKGKHPEYVAAEGTE